MPISIDLYECEVCGHKGVLNAPLGPVGAASVPCKSCGERMNMLREANEYEIRNLPFVTPSGFWGTILSRANSTLERHTATTQLPEPKPKQRRSLRPIAGPDSEIIFVPDVAAMLNYTEAKVRRLAKAGTLPGFKTPSPGTEGKEWRFHRRSIEQWLQKRCSNSLPPTSPAPASPSPTQFYAKKTAKLDLPTDRSPRALREKIGKMGIKPMK